METVTEAAADIDLDMPNASPVGGEIDVSPIGGGMDDVIMYVNLLFIYIFLYYKVNFQVLIDPIICTFYNKGTCHLCIYCCHFSYKA